MLKYTVYRLGQMAPVLFFVSIIIFGLTVMLPGDPTVTILGEFSTPAQREIARVQYGLDQPVPVQYVRWIGRVAKGDFGRSLRTNERVLDLMVERLPVTVEVSILSIVIAIGMGVPLGIAAAVWRNTWIDVTASSVALSSLAIPHFWVGILLIQLFSLVLGWLPPSGFVPLFEDPVQNLRLMIMPALTLGTAFAALIMRQTRASILEVLGEDYIRTARAKGLSETVVLLKHALRNALIPVVTVTGLQVGKVLGGSVITETIFSLPGLGRMVVEAIFSRDFPVVQGGVLFIVLVILMVNLVTDLIYTSLDPRIEL